MYNAPSMTVQVTTGNVRTAMDKYDSTVLNNNAKNPLGAIWYDAATSTKYRYVRYNSSANSAVQAFPGVVYWTDAAMTTVSSTMSEGLSTKANNVAGYAMINSTDYSGLTAAILNGNYIWIAVAGYVKAAASIASTAVDDVLIGSATAWLPARIATGSSITNLPVAIALTAVSAAVTSDVFVKVESL